MSQLTDTQLTTEANVIKNEINEGANTATRVGVMLNDIIDNKINNDKISIDGTLAGNSDTEVPSEKAVKTYVDNKIPYKVYTALLTQSGGDNYQELSSGDLTIGVTYLINHTVGDFSNVGAPNNNADTYFVATGTTPNSWGGGNVSYNTGAPVVTVLENTIGNIWFIYEGIGNYSILSDSLFTSNKTTILNGTISEGVLFNRLIASDGTGFGSPVGYFIYGGETDRIVLRTIGDVEVFADSILTSKILIEIKVYN